MKPGWLTTEFWMALAAAVILVISQLTGDQISRSVDSAALAAIVWGYIRSRADTKANVIQAEAKVQQTQVVAGAPVSDRREVV